jgi:hypothetical protein
MQYYTIYDNTLLIANNKSALTAYYDNVFELPEDYEEGKYIIGDVEEEIEVPDYDDEGNPIIIEYEDTEVIVDFDEEGKPIGTQEITVIKHKQQTHTETVTVKKLVLNPNYEEEQAEKREAEFNKAFFNTSLGYIRRAVTMQNGSKKDFLSDLVLSIKAGLEQGLDVKILTYDKPPFDEDVTDWTEYQHVVSATPQFIMECLMQTSNDFLPINEEE